MQDFLQGKEEKKWDYSISSLIWIWLGEKDKETVDFIMLLSSVIFFLFTLPSWFSSTSGCLREKIEMAKIAVESSFCYSKQKLLNIIGRGFLLVVEEWARALTQNCISRKIVVSGEELCSCSTGRGQATNFLLTIGFVVFKELYVGGQVSHPYVYFVGKIGDIHQY